MMKVFSFETIRNFTEKRGVEPDFYIQPVFSGDRVSKGKVSVPVKRVTCIYNYNVNCFIWNPNPALIVKLTMFW